MTTDNTQQPDRKTGSVTESIFSKDGYVIPLAKVQHIAPRSHSIAVVMDSSTYNSEIGEYNNAVFLPMEIAGEFTSAWCRYRSELEHDTLMDLSPPAPQPAPASVDRKAEIQEVFNKETWCYAFEAAAVECDKQANEAFAGIQKDPNDHIKHQLGGVYGGSITLARKIRKLAQGATL